MDSSVVLNRRVTSSEILTHGQVLYIQQAYNVIFVMDQWVNGKEMCLFCSRPPDDTYYNVDKNVNMYLVNTTSEIQDGVQSQFSMISHLNKYNTNDKSD